MPIIKNRFNTWHFTGELVRFPGDFMLDLAFDPPPAQPAGRLACAQTALPHFLLGAFILNINDVLILIGHGTVALSCYIII